MMVKSSGHPGAKKGYVAEHRLVAEREIGRFLEPQERVHHINCVKDDNKPSNLIVCENDREHFLVHGSLNKCVADLLESGALVFDLQSMRYSVNPEILSFRKDGA